MLTGILERKTERLKGGGAGDRDHFTDKAFALETRRLEVRSPAAQGGFTVIPAPGAQRQVTWGQVTRGQAD